MKKRFVVASLLAGGLLFSGCTTHPGAAAVYEGKPLVTEASVEALAASFGSQVPISRTSLVSYLAYVNLLDDDIKAENTLDPSTFEADGTAQCKQGGINYSKASKETKQLCNLFAMANGTGNEEFNKAFEKANEALQYDVTFSPRYAIIASGGQNPYPSYILDFNTLKANSQGAVGQGGASTAY